MHEVGRVERLDGEPGGVDLDVDTGGERVGGAQPPALCRLGGVPGRAGWAAEQQGDGAQDGGVGRPPGEDDLGAGVDGVGDRLVAHQPDDPLAAQQRRLVEWAGGFQGDDAAVAELGPQPVGVLLAVEPGDPQPEPLLPGDPLDLCGHPVDTVVGPAGAARADDHRDAGRLAGDDEDAQVAGDRFLGRLGGAGGEVVGPRVGGPAVDGDGVGAEGDAAGHALGGEAEAEHPDRDDHPGNAGLDDVFRHDGLPPSIVVVSGAPPPGRPGRAGRRAARRRPRPRRPRRPGRRPPGWPPARTGSR